MSSVADLIEPGLPDLQVHEKGCPVVDHFLCPLFNNTKCVCSQAPAAQVVRHKSLGQLVVLSECSSKFSSQEACVGISHWVGFSLYINTTAGQLHTYTVRNAPGVCVWRTRGSLHISLNLTLHRTCKHDCK